MWQSARGLFVAGVVSLCAGGCDYDPGHDYAVTATWLINGYAPDKALCDAFDVSTMRLTLSTPGTKRTLEAPCDQNVTFDDGSVYGGFSSTTAFDYDVIYTYKLDMVSASGEVIATTDTDTFQAFYGDGYYISLRPLELFSPLGDLASFSAAWTVSDASDVAQACADAGIETVAVWIYSITDEKLQDGVQIAAAPCRDGQYASSGPALAFGDYQVKYVALDSRNAIADQGAPFEVVVDQAGDVALPRQRFLAK